MLKNVRHVGIVVQDFERAVERFKGFGFSCKEVIENKEVGIRAAFFPVGGSQIEFLNYPDPLKQPDPVVRAQKGAINHLCFEVDNLEESIRAFEKNGAQLAEGSPKAGAHGRIAFLNPETTEGVLIELCEVSQDRS